MEELKIETQLNLKDNLKAIYWLTYTKPSFILLNGMGVIMLLSLINNLVTGNIDISNTQFMLSLLYILFMVLMPFIIYYKVKENYKLSAALRKVIVYTFTNDNIEMLSDNLHVVIPWGEVYKVVESNGFFYIYRNKNTANLLPKRFFTEDEVDKLRTIIRNSSVKAKLKK